MAYRNFETPDLSRRTLLRWGGYATLGAGLSALPFGNALLAREGAGWANVRRLARDYVAKGKVPNLLVTIGNGSGQEMELVGGGTLAFGSAAEVGPDTLYRIYSMTKPITGMAAMMLIDEGKFGLDTPLHEILPAFRDMKVQREYDGAITADNLEPAKTPITIRHLLTHTAGLGYGIVQKGPIARAYEAQGLIPGQVSRLPIPGLDRGTPVGSLEAFADGLAELPLVLQPGTRWSYSVSLDLMGRVIEVVEGKPFDTVLQERLFDPLGMTSTWFRVPKAETYRLTDNYGVRNGTALPIDPAAVSIYLDKPAFPFGGAGLVSSPADYDKFLRMLLNYGKLDGRRVMSEEAVRIGASNLLPPGATTQGTWIEGQGHGAGGRSVSGTFGWGGAAGTLAAVDFSRGLRTALWTQYMPAESYPIRTEFLSALEKDIAALQLAKAA